MNKRLRDLAAARLHRPKLVTPAREKRLSDQRCRGVRFSRSREKARSSLYATVERTNRLGGGLQQNLAALVCEISLGFRREMHIAHLARAENELLASALEDELRFVFREHV